MGLTDAQWAVLAPLIEQCRPRAKVPPRHLRRTISTTTWRHDNGAKWGHLTVCAPEHARLDGA
jgi:hypothetical protein